MADRLEERHPELEAAEFEAERPARELSGLPKLVVATGGWLLGPARPPERAGRAAAALPGAADHRRGPRPGGGRGRGAPGHPPLGRGADGRRATGGGGDVSASWRARVVVSCIVALVAAVGLAGCGGGQGQRLSIATGGSGGVYFVYGGGIAEQIGEHLDGYQATAEVTSASVDNMYLIADGKSDLAFALADTAADAVNGTDTFAGEKVPAQARLYNNLTQVATVKGKGIASI